MEGILITGLMIFAFIAIYQQFRIVSMEDQTFRALQNTCERLDLIKKGLSVDDILELAEKYKQENQKGGQNHHE